MKKVFIAFGSNLGNNIQNINQALAKVKKLGKIIDTSFLYRTDPMYNTDQNIFLNGAILLQTDLSPNDLISKLQGIERNLGRTDEMRKIWKGPRTIDLDIIFYDSEIIDTEDLKVPHPRLAERDFVLKPLLDIDKNFIHPILGKSIQSLDHENDKNNKQLSHPRRVSPILNNLDQTEYVFDFTKMTGKLGVLNCTPDSMSSAIKGKIDYDLLYHKAQEYIKEGFEFLDIGGESTRPDAPEINDKEEISRIKPLLSHLRESKESKKPVLSIDTRKASVAKFAVNNGASIINDISAGVYDSNVWMILNHTRGTPSTMTKLNSYSTSLIDEVCHELKERISLALSKGIYRWNIIADPGIGFAKSKDQNMSLIQNLDQFCSKIDFPTTLSFSEKKFLKLCTDGNTIYGNTVLSGISIQKGASILRIHDPKIAKSINIADRIYKNKKIESLN